MAFQTALKIAILESGLRQDAICRQAELTPWRLSKIIHGVTSARASEKRALARLLGKSVRELFPAMSEVA